MTYGGFAYGGSEIGSISAEVVTCSAPSANLIVMELLEKPPGSIDTRMLSEYINNFLENSRYINK